jgi:hypothetical protein
MTIFDPFCHSEQSTGKQTGRGQNGSDTTTPRTTKQFPKPTADLPTAEPS